MTDDVYCMDCSAEAGIAHIFTSTQLCSKHGRERNESEHDLRTRLAEAEARAEKAEDFTRACVMQGGVLTAENNRLREALEDARPIVRHCSMHSRSHSTRAHAARWSVENPPKDPTP